MADESKDDAEHWDDQDWAASHTRSEPRSKRAVGFAVGGMVGLVVLVVGVFLWRQTAENNTRQAEMERRMEMEARALEERLREEERLNTEIRARVNNELQLDPTEALLLMARDPEALNNTGLFLLNTMDEPDEAIEKFREAAKLDPKFAGNLELARKRKAQKEKTAPLPREID